jgi:hypothetical protein
MIELRAVVVDFWWGNDDPAAAQKYLRTKSICQALKQHGFALELQHPADPASRPDIAFFGCFGSWFGNQHHPLDYPDAFKVFWCDENLHAGPEFAAYRDYPSLYDFSFTYDPTTDRNFHAAGLRTVRHLEALGQPMPGQRARALAAAKSEFACFLYGNGDESQEGVRLRNDFFRRLSALHRVNSGGPVMNNMGGNVPYDQTGEFVARHRFVLSMENDIQPGYVTEKILHGFLHGSVPVYCGAPDVARFYDGGSFLHYTGDNFDEVVEAMERLDSDPDQYAAVLGARKLAQPRRPEFEVGALAARFAAIAEALGQRVRRPPR